MSERPATNVPPTMLAERADRLSALFEAHADRLYRLARRLVSSADDALDLVQETFLRAAHSPDSIPRGLRDEEAWLVRVLVNVRRDQWRKEAIRKRHDFELSHPTAQHDDPERTFLIRTTVWRALDYLPPRRRAIVVMYELEGLSMAAVASLLGISAITVRWHLSRGRRELARRLKLQLGESDEQSQKCLAERRPAPSRSSAP
jgi:RNA polymerase sigma-70 factor (ECF subfamily)